jgi:hypothetical protein
MYLTNEKSFFQQVAYRLRYRKLFKNYSKANLILNEEEMQWLHTLRKDGFVAIENFIPENLLHTMQSQFQEQLEALNFEVPCFGQSLVDPVRDADLIDNYFFLDKEQLVQRQLSFSKEDVTSLMEVTSKYSPSTLTVNMLQYSNQYLYTWLNERLLKVIASYMGLVPKLVEAYVRRNFPAKYRTMNHFWHRDLNHKHYLLKVFFFLSDCKIENGSHEFIRGTHDEFSLLNGKRYFDDYEVDEAYPSCSPEREIKFIKAGTVVIEDTRGVHRARMPIEGYRDLGFAVFQPYDNAVNYQINSKKSLDSLSAFQKMFMPSNV